MLIVPGILPMQGHSQTRNSRELTKYVEQAVRDYRRDHPDVTDTDVHAALTAVTSMARSPDEVANQRRIAIVAVSVTIAMIGAIFALTGGGRYRAGGGEGDLVVTIVAGVAAACGLLIALVRMVRRG